MDIGIIGFGKFGQFLAKLLKGNFDICAADIKDKKTDANKIGVKFVSLSEAASKDVVIFCVPVSSLEAALNNSKSFLKEGCVVMDMCSVKEIPVDLMEKTLPVYVDIVSTHPLFGPESGIKGVEGFAVVLCPVRTKKNSLAIIKNMFTKIGLSTIITTPKYHDMQIAETQSLVHFIGLALKNLGIRSNKIKTPSFDKLMEMKKSMEKDAKQLSMDILRYNRYSKGMRKKFIRELQKIDGKASK